MFLETLDRLCLPAPAPGFVHMVIVLRVEML